MHSIIRFNPKPIAQCTAQAKEFKDETIRIIEAESLSQDSSSPPGTVIEQNKEACHIATGSRILGLKRVQLAGKKLLRNVQKYAQKRAELKSIISNPNTSIEEREAAPIDMTPWKSARKVSAGIIIVTMIIYLALTWIAN